MKTIYLKTTETCNLDCPHCYTSGSKGRKVFWDVKKVKDWINRFIESLPKKESIHFEIHGGEPFISKTEDLLEVIQFIRSFNQEQYSIGVTSNLVFTLTQQRMAILDEVDGIGTSWDAEGRFNKPNQLPLWKQNINIIRKAFPDKHITCNTVLSKPLIDYYPFPNLMERIYLPLGFDAVRFEKITLSGSANINRDIVPFNGEVNNYLLGIHHHLEKNPHLRDRINVVNMEEIYTKFENRIMNSGTYFRQCERNLFTLNADGTIGGCPNDAPDIHYGEITHSIHRLNDSPNRMFQIIKESQRHDECYECSFIQYCGGGCYKLHWDETGCPTPKKLLSELKSKGI